MYLYTYLCIYTSLSPSPSPSFFLLCAGPLDLRGQSSYYGWPGPQLSPFQILVGTASFELWDV